MDPSPQQSPRSWAKDLPATGAVLDGDNPGQRKFATVASERALALEGGGSLQNIEVAYETWGELSAAADNAILVCHALTGDSHAANLVPGSKVDAGWWQGYIGPGKPIDTDRFFVVCSNVLGGCGGTTGPASINADTGAPYGPDFPTVTIRDMVRVQARLANQLGVDRWLAVVGGSMGGMQVLEWALMHPSRVRAIAPLATTLAASAWQIGLSAMGRLAVTLDANWRGGNYYDAAPGEGPHAGLATARAIAQLTYKSHEKFEERFGRTPVDPTSIFGQWDRFQIESYLDYHGEKLVRRFDANSYITLNKAMDLHDIGRMRGGKAKALRRLKAPVLTVSVSTDGLYHPYLQQEIHDLTIEQGGHCEYSMIESSQGHDGFLTEAQTVGPLLADFLDRVDKGVIGSSA